MYKKFLLVTILAAFSTHVWAGPADLEKRKVELNNNINKVVGQCRCLAIAVSGKEKLFPIKAKATDKSIIKTQAAYLDLISDMKVNAGKDQTRIKAIVRDWNPKKDSPEDLKDLDVKVSGELRALASFYIQPFNIIAKEIYNHSPDSSRINIDPAQCGIVQNKR